MSDEAKIRELRQLLPATSAGIYLDTATRGPMSAEVAAAMREADEWELTVGRVWDGREEDVAQRHEEARAVVGALIGADPASVTLTHGLPDALELARAQVGTAGRIVDASHRVGVIGLQVVALQAEAVVFAADRWLLGPEGTGALWLRDASGLHARRDIPRTTLIGLARSVGWLEMYVGLDWIYERTQRLARRLFEALEAIDGVEVVTPSDEMAAIVTFRLANWRAAEAGDELSRRVHALVRPLPDLDAIRASVGWFNTEAELDGFAGAVAEMARHTPATLPRRPSLIVLGES